MPSNEQEVLANNGSVNSSSINSSPGPKSSEFTDKRSSETNMFNCTDMGRALQERWRSPIYRDIVSKELMRLSNTPVTVSQKSNLKSSQNDKLELSAEDDDKDSLLVKEEKCPSEGEAMMNNETDSSVQISALQKLVVSAVEALKKDIPKKPWHETIKFVSFDLPLNDGQMLHWIETLVEEAEVDEDAPSTNDNTLPTTVYEKRETAKKRIISMFPDMREHKDTQEFINNIILPFRHFFMSSVVCSVLGDLGQGQGPHSSVTPSMVAGEDENNQSTSSSVPEGIVKGAHVYPRHSHAAQHATNLDAVLFIDSMVPHKVDLLYRYVLDDLLSGDTSMLTLGEMDVVQKKNSEGVIVPVLKRKDDQSLKTLLSERGLGNSIPYTSYYAQYYLIYLDDGDDWDDGTFIKAMLPLAEGGLALAQYDIGMCFVALHELDLAMAWLEKAALCGHSKAMLQLARLHCTMLFEADKMVASAAARKEKEAAASGEGNEKLGLNDGGAIKGYTALKTNQEKRHALMKFHMRRCQVWLGNLSDSKWDRETVVKDIPEGDALKAVIDKEAIPLIRKCSVISNKRSMWDNSVLFATVGILTAIAILALFFLSGSALRSMNGNESLFAGRDDSHVDDGDTTL